MLTEYTKYLFEMVFVGWLVFKAILFVPQAIKIHRAKKSEELSLLTFVGLNITQIFTIIHAYLHQDYILMFGMLINFMFCLSVTCMIVLYRK